MNNNAFRFFFVDNIEYILNSQRLKVQFIGNIEVSGNGFRVVVDDNGFIAHFLQRPYAVYGAVVKFYALTDTDRTGAEYNYSLLVAYFNLILGFVAGVVVRSCSFKFRSAGINHFVGRQNAVSLTHIANFELSLAYAFTDNSIGKAHSLSLAQQARSQLVSFQSFFHFNDVLDFGEEPQVNLGDVVNLFQSNTTADSLSNNEAALVVNAFDAVMNFFIAQSFQLRHFQMVEADFQATYCFQHGSFKAALNCHNLTGSLHLSAQSAVSGYEFIERPTREFQYDIVNGRLKASLSLFGNSVFNLVQVVADSDFAGNLSNRITGSFGSQCGRTAYTRVNFDYIVVFGVRVESQLYVTAANYAQLTHDIDRSLTQQLYFFIAQSLCRSHNDGVAGVYANGVQVFHGADGDAVISSVADYFVFDFFPAGDAAFNQALADGAVAQALLHDINQLFLVFSNTATGTAEGISRTDNQRIADFLAEVASSLNGFYDGAFRNRLMDFLHSFLEHFAVFATFDCTDLSAQQTNIVLVQNALLFQFHSHVQTNLPTKSCQQGIRTLTFDNFFNEFNADRFNIYTVSHMHISHNGCRVTVNQYNLQAFFLQSTASLSTCIVKLCCLTDDNRAGADNENLFNIFKFRHN